MADPVSWYLIEPGWQVAGPGGEPLGSVSEVVGDPDGDVFDGLRLDDGRFVPAELVGRIEEGRVEIAREPTTAEERSAPRGEELRRDRSDDL